MRMSVGADLHHRSVTIFSREQSCRRNHQSIRNRLGHHRKLHAGARLQASLRVFRLYPDFDRGAVWIQRGTDHSDFAFDRIFFARYRDGCCIPGFEQRSLGLRNMRPGDDLRDVHYGKQWRSRRGHFSRIKRAVRHHPVNRTANLGVTQLRGCAQIFALGGFELPRRGFELLLFSYGQ